MTPALRLQILLGLALALVAGYYWIAGGDGATDSAALIRENQPVSTYLVNSRSWSYAVDGSLAEVMEADRVEHFGMEDVSLLMRPRFYSHDGNDRTWTASADRGRLVHATNILALQDDVLLINDQTGGTLETQSMQLNLEQKTATSTTPVTVRQDTSILRAGGMFADLNRQTIQLRPNVESVYDPTGS
ncbi:LPS export ABC transporter periplasmic protein LptC [Kineobactrum sediminis]|uniref:LPS export ABC transporter periplasmic protein LptC n=1 Tax=Kineobactrum sediminis TaxID=1905677 RepID=UPI0013905758|nr:LPS export ABC transporter periplasmic protein LptC [Kineobactrum sediminis]